MPLEPSRQPLTQSAASSRQIDNNGWFEVKNNPLSRVGVFPYSGKSIGAPDPDKIYHVYRPEEELSDPACIESFKLLPWIDEHAMLGPAATGLTSPEAKGVQGVTGEEIYFADGTLYGNLKLFSDNMQSLIDDFGKRELSMGYRCKYEFSPGIWNGQRYDAIQRTIRGNHVALVAEGRMGPSVAVLDHFKFTLDAKEFAKMPDENKDGAEAKKGMSIEELTSALEDLMPKVEKLMAAMNSKGSSAEASGVTESATDAESDEAKAKAAKDAEECKAKEMKDAEEKAKADGEKKEGMDAMDKRLAKLEKGGIKALLGEVSRRDQLAKQLSEHVGTFDHAEMTLDEVAAYGVEKLKIKCDKGTEAAVLAGFLHNRSPNRTGFAMDSSNRASGGLDSMLNSAKK